MSDMAASQDAEGATAYVDKQETTDKEFSTSGRIHSTTSILASSQVTGSKDEEISSEGNLEIRKYREQEVSSPKDNAVGAARKAHVSYTNCQFGDNNTQVFYGEAIPNLQGNFHFSNELKKQLDEIIKQEVKEQVSKVEEKLEEKLEEKFKLLLGARVLYDGQPTTESHSVELKFVNKANCNKEEIEKNLATSEDGRDMVELNLVKTKYSSIHFHFLVKPSEVTKLLELLENGEFRKRLEKAVITDEVTKQANGRKITVEITNVKLIFPESFSLDVAQKRDCEHSSNVGGKKDGQGTGGQLFTTSLTVVDDAPDESTLKVKKDGQKAKIKPKETAEKSERFWKSMTSGQTSYNAEKDNADTVQSLQVTTYHKTKQTEKVDTIKDKVTKDKVLENLKKQEQHLALLLQENMNKDLEKDSDVLQHMGIIYHLRGLLHKQPVDFVKAASLFNSSLIRTGSKDKLDILRTIIIINEKAFLQQVCKKAINQVPSNFTSSFKEMLNCLREDIEIKVKEVWRLTKVNYSIHSDTMLRIKEENMLVKDIKSLSRYTSIRMKLFLKEILHACYANLGPAPQKFTIVGLGSLAREEMTPYSDLDFVILIEDDNADKQYFRLLTHLFHLFVLNLGETPLPALGIDSLNDFDKSDANWFYDAITINGFCLDGAMPWACKTPLGRPDRGSKIGIELIKTPEDMAKFVQHDYPSGYHLAEILRTTTFIDGCSELLDKFIELCFSFGNDPDIKNYGLQRLIEDVKRFRKKLLLDKLVTNHSKQKPPLHDYNTEEMITEVYRLPSIITNNFKLIYNLTSNSPWDLLDKMVPHILTREDSRNLQVIISIADLIRLKAYSANKGSYGSLSFLKQLVSEDTQNVTKRRTYFCDNEQLIFRFYFTVVPLINTLLSNKLTMHNIRYLSQSLRNLYDDSYRIQGQLHMIFLSYQKAVDCFRRALKSSLQCTSSEIANLHSDLSSAFYELGDYDNALQHRIESFQIWENTTGSTEHVAAALCDLGVIHHSKGNFDTALTYFHQSLFILEKNSHPQRLVAAAMGNIGSIHEHMGNYDVALRYHLKSTEMRSQIYGNAAHPDIASCLDSIGLVYDAQGKYDDALMYHKKALEMKKIIYSDGAHPNVVQSLNNIGAVYSFTGNYYSALKYYQESLNMGRLNHMNIAHPDVAVSLNNIAVVYSELGDYDSALSFHHESLEMKLKIYGSSPHPDVATSISNIGSLYHKLQNVDQALKYLQRALQMKKSIYGSLAHPSVVTTLINIANVFQASGDSCCALQYQQQALEIRKQIHGDGAHPDVAESLDNIATVYASTRDYDNALAYAQHALMMRKQINGDLAHPDIAQSLCNIASVYGAFGDNDCASTFHQQALQIRRQIHGDGAHPDVAESLDNIATVYAAACDYDNALVCAQHALMMRKQIIGDVAHPDIAQSLSNIASMYTAYGGYRRALTYHQQALQMRRQIHGDSAHPDVAQSLDNIATVYAATLDYDNALKYQQQVLQMRKQIHGDDVHPYVTQPLDNTASWCRPEPVNQTLCDLSKKVYISDEKDHPENSKDYMCRPTPSMIHDNTCADDGHNKECVNVNKHEVKTSHDSEKIENDCTDKSNGRLSSCRKYSACNLV